MLYLGLIPLIAGSDLIVKSGIERMGAEEFPRDIAGTKGRVQFRKLHNSGFPMGALREFPELIHCLPLAVSSIMLFRISLLLPRRGHSLEKLGLSAALGGALSNLFDRFFRGHVVDYLYVELPLVNRIVFNLGDVFIALGALLTGAGRARGGKRLGTH
ncbi:MAG: signal peptidase II [Lachnospiraceae bacterium]